MIKIKHKWNRSYRIVAWEVKWIKVLSMDLCPTSPHTALVTAIPPMTILSHFHSDPTPFFPLLFHLPPAPDSVYPATNQSCECVHHWMASPDFWATPQKASLCKSTCQVALIYTAPKIFMKHVRTPHAWVETPALW